MSKTVLILGASGKIGSHAAEAFWNAGWCVRRFDRATDTLMEAAAECDVIVNGLNPPNYENWARNIPRITQEVIDAAEAHGATVIVPGNVYNFGMQSGVWSENTPQIPCTRKGKIRVEMEQSYRAAAARGVRTIILRGGDFIDPNQNGTVMSLLTMKDLHKGKLMTLGDPDVERAYCYLPDWATAAVALADRRDSLQMFEDIPFASAHFSINQLKTYLEQTLSRPLKLRRFPWWAMRLSSPFWGLAYEMLEMRYLFETNHHLSDEKLKRLLPQFRPSALETILSAEIPAPAQPEAQGGRMSIQTSL